MIFRSRQFQVEDQEVALNVVRLYRRGKVDYADALIGAGTKAAGFEIAVTFNKKAAGMETFRLL